jgi:hypothetical protein
VSKLAALHAACLDWLISIAVFNQFAQHLVKANACEVKKFFDALAPRGHNRHINIESFPRVKS